MSTIVLGSWPPAIAWAFLSLAIGVPKIPKSFLQLDPPITFSFRKFGIYDLTYGFQDDLAILVDKILGVADSVEQVKDRLDWIVLKDELEVRRGLHAQLL